MRLHIGLCQAVFALKHISANVLQPDDISTSHLFGDSRRALDSGSAFLTADQSCAAQASISEVWPMSSERPAFYGSVALPQRLATLPAPS